MTRLIKFRAWDKEIKVMRSWVQERSGNQPLGHFFTRQDYELMQFTGLLDKNGKEIYEGDIMKTPYGNYAVEFDIGQFQYENFDHYGVNGEGPCLDEGEIIGNIHENPELLK